MKSRAPIQLTGHLEIPLPPSRLWFLISHIKHLLKMVGMTRVSHERYAEGTHILYQIARPEGWLRWMGGWKEYPHEWIRNDSIFVLREFDRGPLVRYGRGIELIPTTQGTQVRVFVEMTPRWFWVEPLLKRRANKWIRGVLKYCKKFLAIWVQQQRYDFPRNQANQLRIKNWERRMADYTASTPHTETLLGRLKQHLTEGTDDEVVGMRPKELADQWGMDRDQVVRLFLFAAAEGLLTLEWHTVCPISRLTEDIHFSLQDVPQRSRSHFTLKPFDVGFDTTLELRFSVSPEIRATRRLGHEPTGPSDSPHVWIQAYLPPGGRIIGHLEMGEETFRLRTFRTNETCHLIPGARETVGKTNVQLVLTRQGWLAPTAVFRPGEQRVELVNESHNPALVVLENTRPVSHALTAAEVTAAPEFFHLFPQEVPQAGHRYQAEGLTFLVADIPHATDKLEAWGNRTGLHRVHHLLLHFAEHVGRNHGRVVKVNGDQVFAVFHSLSRAAQAGLDLVRDAAQLAEKLEWPEAVAVRASLTHGPSLAIYRAHSLDYFGFNVSRAFRNLRKAQGGQLVVDRELWESEDFKLAVHGEHYKATVGPGSLVRLRPSEGPKESTDEVDLKTGTE